MKTLFRRLLLLIAIPFAVPTVLLCAAIGGAAFACADLCRWIRRVWRGI